MDTSSSLTRDDRAAAARSSAAAPGVPALKPHSLQIRLILLVAGTLLPMLTLSAAIVYQSYVSARESASERVLQTTRGALAAVDRELQGQIAALQILALSPALQAGDFEAFRADALRFLGRYPPPAGISISDGSGQILMHSSVPAGGTLPKRRDLEAVAFVFGQARPYVSNIYIGGVTEKPLFTVDVPVLRDDGVIYDLAFNVPRAIFFDMLKQLSLPEGWVVSIFDRIAHHIARLPPLSDPGITSAAETLRVELDKGDNRIVETISLEGERILSAFTRSTVHGWVVAIGMPIETIDEPARRSLVTALAAGLLLILVGFAFARRLATQLVAAEAHRELLVNELNHRVKNTLSSVQGIVARGLHDSSAPAAAREAIEARILALSHAHNILSEKNWQDAQLGEIVHSIFEPYLGRHLSTLKVGGPAVALSPRVAIALAMILNELVTNAVKYGALSSPSGVVALSWTTPGAGRLRMEWTESGGPAVTAPSKSGYGTRFIERAVVHELSGTYTATYRTVGLASIIEISL